MLDAFAGKWPDVIIGLIVGMVTGLVCLFIDRSTKRGGDERPTADRPLHISMRQVTHVSVQIANQSPKSSVTQWVAAAGIALVAGAYILNRDDVITFTLAGTISLLVLWLTTGIYTLWVGQVSGLRWLIYMLAMFATLAVGASTVLPAVIAPPVPPDHVELPIKWWQGVAQEYGLKVLVKILGAEGIGWLAMHVVGVALYFFALKEAAFNMFFYALAGSGRLKLSDDTSWVVRLASSYAKPFPRLLTLILLMLLSYYLASGILLHWWLHDMPMLIRSTFDGALNGRRASIKISSTATAFVI